MQTSDGAPIHAQAGICRPSVHPSLINNAAVNSEPGCVPVDATREAAPTETAMTADGAWDSSKHHLHGSHGRTASDASAQADVENNYQHPVKVQEDPPASFQGKGKEMDGDLEAGVAGASNPVSSELLPGNGLLEAQPVCLQEFHARLSKTKHLMGGSRPVASIAAAGFSNCPVSIAPLYNHVLKVLNQIFSDVVPKEYCWAEIIFENQSALVTREMNATIPDRQRILNFLRQMNLRPGDDLDLYIRSTSANNASVFIALYANRIQRQRAHYKLFDFRLPRDVKISDSTWLKISPKALKLLSQGQLHLVEVRNKTHLVQGHVINPRSGTVEPIWFDMVLHEKSCLLRGFHQLAGKFGTQGVFRASYSKEQNGLVISYLCGDDVLAGSAANLMSEIAKMAGVSGVAGQKRKIDEQDGTACKKVKSDLETAQAAQALVGLQDGSSTPEEIHGLVPKKKDPAIDPVSLPPPTAEDLNNWLRLPAMSYICDSKLAVHNTSMPSETTLEHSLCLCFQRLAFLQVQKHFEEGRMKAVRDVRGEVMVLTLLPLSLHSATFERHFDGVHAWATNLDLKAGDTVQIFQDNAGDLVLLPSCSRKTGPSTLQMSAEGAEQLCTRRNVEGSARLLRFLFRKKIDDSSGSILFSKQATSILQEKHPKSGLSSFPRQHVGNSLAMIAECSNGHFVVLTSQVLDDNRLLLQGLQNFIPPHGGSGLRFLDFYRGIHHEVILTIPET